MPDPIQPVLEKNLTTPNNQAAETPPTVSYALPLSSVPVASPSSVPDLSPTGTTASLDSSPEPTVPVQADASETTTVTPMSDATSPSVPSDTDQINTWTTPAEPPQSSKKILLPIVIILLVIAVIAGGIFVSQKALLKPTSETAPTLSPSVTPAKTNEPSSAPSPNEQFEKTSLKIQILNGNGQAGTAGTAAKLLEENGYTQKIATANADKYDYSETVIKIKEDKKAYLDLIAKDLKSQYQVSSQAAALSKDSEFDVVIIIGKK